jgi:DNA primase large subunit
MLDLGTDEMAKYPFLAESGQYLKDKGFSLEQFGKDPDLKPILDKALNRIEIATTGKIYRSEVANLEELDLEVFSFLLAVILLKLSGMNTLIRRFSLAEARRAEKYLERDLADLSNKTKEELATRIIKELFSIEIQKRDDFFVIPVSAYLKHSVNFHEREWKLINRRVDKGRVILTPHETVRLIRKELDNYIASKIRSAGTPSMIETLKKPVERLVSLSKKFYVPTVVSTEFPPCIKHAIDVLDRGENLPHSGRFLLGTYLLGVGQTVEQIAPLFKNAPDYNERITMYQLNHLRGSSGSGTEYKCPSCERVKSKDLCYATSDCDGIINPIQFKKKKTLNA